ncbi:hypothetical protein KIN20_032502 [Parelaphostrongylus tenuis]|uniref:Uncharacterized protein n=1 Tax=Parelaphostrongylus tenuis TaxID=148309 RepID=A0AAD5R757_PARTN|nr:hypothetical protein KIN20_000030 [Parelaphostrongylus tenuis]KAJ1370712.1 hypothetical protein KIN20_032502 [Parelaphostrongylus tenuis]
MTSDAKTNPTESVAIVTESDVGIQDSSIDIIKEIEDLDKLQSFPILNRINAKKLDMLENV